LNPALAPAELTATLAALTQQVQRSEPALLERTLRGLLIHLHYRLSDLAAVQRVGDAASQPLMVVTPTRFSGRGRIEVESDVVFGVVHSPEAWSCAYFEARTPASLIRIGRGTVFNNRAQVMSEGAGIHIGQRCLFGNEVMLVDSNFHCLPVALRRQPDDSPQPLVLGDDVFIGARACLLKGVRIGAGSVVAAGSLVPPGFEAPPLSIVAGNPARVVGQVPS
jgi:acetyltransferase-like isoleucine patch superfamily enzyme